ncbi:MAG TPA: hypothetical protein VE754_05225 [Actinomycetota bacterium]|jgi:hypothetical protein|nr:hypothetical protein [Actinomycetota bacterium]
MRPSFAHEVAQARVEDLRRAACRAPAQVPGWREALGMRLVRTGFRVMRGWDR